MNTSYRGFLIIFVIIIMYLIGKKFIGPKLIEPNKENKAFMITCIIVLFTVVLFVICSTFGVIFFS